MRGTGDGKSVRARRAEADRYQLSELPSSCWGTVREQITPPLRDLRDICSLCFLRKQSCQPYFQCLNQIVLAVIKQRGRSISFPATTVTSSIQFISEQRSVTWNVGHMGQKECCHLWLCIFKTEYCWIWGLDSHFWFIWRQPLWAWFTKAARSFMVQRGIQDPESCKSVKPWSEQEFCVQTSGHLFSSYRYLNAIVTQEWFHSSNVLFLERSK